MFRRRRGKTPRITVQEKGNETIKEEGNKENVKTCKIHSLTMIFIRRLRWKSFRRLLSFAVVAYFFSVSGVFLNQNDVSSSSSIKFDKRHNFPTIIDLTTFQHADSVVDHYHYNDMALNGHRLMPLEQSPEPYWGGLDMSIPVARRLIPVPVNSIEEEPRIVRHFNLHHTFHCEDVSWIKDVHYTCNSMHELGMSSFVEHGLEGHVSKEESNKIIYSNHGYYRDVWAVGSVNKPSSLYYPRQHSYEDPMDNVNVTMALKTLRLIHNFTEPSMNDISREAIIMEKLTSSPRIMNIYSFCSTSIGTEFIPNEVQSVLVPGSGYATREEAAKSILQNGISTISKNELEPREKLETALAMAESLADLHGFKDGAIVHNDVQPCQWLQRRDNMDSTSPEKVRSHIDSGSLVLGDFNRATIMQWNAEKGSYCKYREGQALGNYRSPEEYSEKALNEKIDVFSFGNNLFAILTGLWNFFDVDDETAQQKVIHGELPFIDERYRNGTKAESRLIDIMENCWKFDPEERIDIFQVVERLRLALKEL